MNATAAREAAEKELDSSLSHTHTHTRNTENSRQMNAMGTLQHEGQWEVVSDLIPLSRR